MYGVHNLILILRIQFNNINYHYHFIYNLISFHISIFKILLLNYWYLSSLSAIWNTIQARLHSSNIVVISRNFEKSIRILIKIDELIKWRLGGNKRLVFVLSTILLLLLILLFTMLCVLFPLFRVCANDRVYSKSTNIIIFTLLLDKFHFFHAFFMFFLLRKRRGRAWAVST